MWRSSNLTTLYLSNYALNIAVSQFDGVCAYKTYKVAILTVVMLLFLWLVKTNSPLLPLFSAVCLLLKTLSGPIPMNTAAPVRLDFVFVLFLLTCCVH